MFNIQDTQTCPYCDATWEDYESVWDYEAEESVDCYRCKRVFIVKPQYKFEGWVMEKQCEKCEEWSEDGDLYCDCGEENDA